MPVSNSTTGFIFLIFYLYSYRYFLDANKSSAPWFGIFGGSGPTKPKQSKQPEASNAATAAAEKRKQALEEKKAAAEAKKAEFEAAKQARLELAAKKKAELEAKKAEAQQKRAALQAAKKEKAAAAKVVAKNKGGTIALQPKPKASPGFFGKKAAPAVSKAPPGVPVISKFKVNRDGSVTGSITGSKNFSQGAQVTTSKLAPNQTVKSGNVVKTVSGSTYFLK
jgi:membrane protein involved in colicin uptake